MNPGSADSAVGSFLAWDTNFFGFRVGRALAPGLTRSSLPEILRWAAAERIRCLYLLAPDPSAETLALALEGGFQFVDVRLDLSCRLDAVRPTEPADRIRQAQPSDQPALESIARVSHLDTRFFKDARFPADKSAELYAEWIRRDLGRHTVFVALAPGTGEPVGYITCQLDPATRHGRIGLLAVAASHTGLGLGASLVRAALGWFGGQGCPLAQVATQAANIPAQRLYQAAGFRTTESAAWFHRWFPASPASP